jgi:hypothetical protein
MCYMLINSRCVLQCARVFKLCLAQQSLSNLLDGKGKGVPVHAMEVRVHEI